MSIYDQPDSYRDGGYQGGYRPSGAGILTILAAALALGLSLLIGLSFIYSSNYDRMRGGNEVDVSRELPVLNQQAEPDAPYLPDARSPDLGNNPGQQSAPPASP